jgi:hypothetical protein
MRARIYLTLSALCLLSAVVNAQTVPALVNYQGRLANPDGTALATGDYQLTFRVYDSATNSGGLVWGPQMFDSVAGQGHGGRIPVVQGYFNVMLGPVDTNGVSLDTAFNATNRFVEIRVGTNSPNVWSTERFQPRMTTARTYLVNVHFATPQAYEH